MADRMRIQSVWYSRRRFTAHDCEDELGEEGIVCRPLPWGHCIWIRTDDVIGTKIQKLGLFDLSVCEMIARLAKPGDLLLDVGANCGQMTSLMSVCAGKQGRVMSFEPHPANFSLLKKNVAMWHDDAEIAAFETALGETPGTAKMNEPQEFEKNTGLASLSEEKSDGRSFEVSVDTLDNVLAGGQTVGVMKMDVEGFEANVLRGANTALREGQIRNIVYEDHEGYRSDVSTMLASRGYRILSPELGMLGPNLTTTGDKRQTNFLATLDLDDAMNAFRGIGYACLRRR